MTVGRWAGTRGTDSVNFQAMPGHSKSMFCGNRLKVPGNLLIPKLNQRVAFLANEVIVLRVAIVVFVNFAVVRAGNLTNEPGIFHVANCPVDCRSTYSNAVRSRLG